MDHLTAKEVQRLTTLLKRTGKSIANFEIAETKMIEWRQEIAHQASTQQKQLSEIRAELDRMQTIISEAGLECFQTAAEETLSQSDDYLHGLKNIEQQLLRQIHDHRAELTRISQHAMTQITQKASEAVHMMDEKLSCYDPRAFNKIATKSCEQVEKSAKATIRLGSRLLKHFEWRSVSLTLATSLTTALIFGLYTNGEYPWEMHQHANNERGAGKVLLEAWPTLTHHEKNKILRSKTS